MPSLRQKYNAGTARGPNAVLLNANKIKLGNTNATWWRRIVWGKLYVFTSYALFLGAVVFLVFATDWATGLNLAESIVSLRDKSPTVLGFWKIHRPHGFIGPNVPSAEEVVKEAGQIHNMVQKLKRYPFFRIMKVDLSKPCPLWGRKELCTSRFGTCSVCECTDDQIPYSWKDKPFEHFVVKNEDGADAGFTPWVEGSYSEPESAPFVRELAGEGDEGHPVYVDLLVNRPAYTEYIGGHIWKLLETEGSCLGRGENATEEIDSLNSCRPEKLFHQFLSGLRTNIKLLSSEYHWPKYPEEERTHGIPTPQSFDWSLTYFRKHVATQEQYSVDLYTTYSFLQRTVCKLEGILRTCESCVGGQQYGDDAQKDLSELLDLVKSLPSCSSQLVEAAFFKSRRKEAFNLAQNLLGLLDCVECEKCRLHGKLKTTALQVAIKAQTAEQHPIASLERNEVIALINALGYFAEAILIMEKFQSRLVVLRVVWLLIIASVAVQIPIISALYRRYKSRSGTLQVKASVGYPDEEVVLRKKFDKPEKTTTSETSDTVSFEEDVVRQRKK